MMMKRKAPARPTYIQAVDEKRQLLQDFFTRNDCFSDTMCSAAGCQIRAGLVFS